MKKITLVAVCILILNSLIAQVPKSFKYQAVVRDAAGNLIQNKFIDLKISILQDQDNGIPVYSEVWEKYSTNEYGLVSVEVGKGTPSGGSFDNIIWGMHTYYLKVELDINAQKEYVLMGTSQIQSVPYALYATDVLHNDDADADPTNEIQDLQLIDNVLTITKNSNPTSVNLSKYIGLDTDEQTLSLQKIGNSVQLSIVRGNTVSFDQPTDFVSKTSGGTFLGPINSTNIVGSGILSLQGNFTLSGTSPVQLTTSGSTNLNLPTSGTLATQDWVSQNISSSHALSNGNIWVGLDNKATAMPANGLGQFLIGNGTGIGSYPISGDASVSQTGVLSLSSLHPGPTQYKIVNIDNKGRVISGLNPNTLAGYGITDGLTTSLSSGNIFIGNSSNIASQVTISGDVTLSNAGVITLSSIVSSGLYTRVNVDSKGRVTFGDNPKTLSEMGILDGITKSLNNKNILIGDANNLASQVVISGDATLTNDGTLNLAVTGISPGTYKSVTVDSKGRILLGSNPTTLGGYGIVDAMSTSHPANAIAASDITNWNTTTWSEIASKPTTLGGFGITDGMSTLHPANVITAADITNWNTTSWSEITNKPNTIADYGITDAMSTSHPANGITLLDIANWNTTSWSEITNTPTTLLGYGISDAMKTSHPANAITNVDITNWNTTDWTEITTNPFSFVSVSPNQLIRYNSSTSRWENWTPNFLTASTEGDPIFTAWNRSTGISVTASQVSDFQTGVTNNAAVVLNTAKISYPGTDATKLAGIQTGAEVNVNADWNAISGDAQILNNPFTFASPANNQLIHYNSTSLKWENFTFNEADPTFTAWNRSTGISITASQVSDFQTGVTNNAAVVLNTAKISYPGADATKLAGIQTGAEVNVNADWNAISGDAQIMNKPTTFSGFGITNDQLTTLNITQTLKLTPSTILRADGTGNEGDIYIYEDGLGNRHIYCYLNAVWKQLD